MANRITADSLQKYILDGENDTVEFKQAIPDHFDIIDRIVSAFANYNGGSVIFGVDDYRKTIIGIDPHRIIALEERYSSSFSKICTVYQIAIGEKTVAVIDVAKSASTIFANGVAYIRTGDRIFAKEGKIRSRFLKEFIDEIQYHNRNPKDTKALELLDDLTTNPERVLTDNTLLYRCRVIQDMKKIDKEPNFLGYGKGDSFVPPANVTRDLRANYRYIPYLYAASHPYTALVEVRPRIGANVSVATIRTNHKLTLLDFSLANIPSKMTEPKRNLFADLSMLFSKPVTSDDDIIDYIPTQYIAEYAKRLGYDGIAFRSSLTPELEDQDLLEHQDLDRYNVVIFNYDKCEPIRSNVFNVTHSYIESKQIDKDINRMDIHTTILDMSY